VPDEAFANPRLTAIYDALDPDRSDLDVYAAMVAEFGARSVLDIGCGTGTFACLLAAQGIDVTAVDPAQASLDVAQGKPFADRVTWLHGDATGLPPLQVDLATMAGNVAQVFLSDADWLATLRGIAAALRPGGRSVFETRVPAREAWREWTPELSRSVTDIPGVGKVTQWYEVLDVDGPFVTFRSVNEFAADGAVIASVSTLRFRGRDEIERSLDDAGLVLEEVRDAPDRPGREFVFVARRPQPA
jgi:SAM-dependent methyltransferase